MNIVKEFCVYFFILFNLTGIHTFRSPFLGKFIAYRCRFSRPGGPSAESRVYSALAARSRYVGGIARIRQEQPKRAGKIVLSAKFV